MYSTQDSSYQDAAYRAFALSYTCKGRSLFIAQPKNLSAFTSGESSAARKHAGPPPPAATSSSRVRAVGGGAGAAAAAAGGIIVVEWR